MPLEWLSGTLPPSCGGIDWHGNLFSALNTSRHNLFSELNIFEYLQR